MSISIYDIYSLPYLSSNNNDNQEQRSSLHEGITKSGNKIIIYTTEKILLLGATSNLNFGDLVRVLLLPPYPSKLINP